MYFTEFTEEGWVNAIKAAVADTTNRPSVISISYGNPEDDQQQGLWMQQTINLVNVLEDPGVISSQGGTYPISDEQLGFLTGELTRVKSARAANQRAVIIACHHPPASTDSKHGGTTGLAKDIDAAAQAAGLWPDAVLSGHAHLYQRFTRSVDGRQIPYIVAGSGGFSATAPRAGTPPAPVTVGEYTLEIIRSSRLVT